MSKNRVTLLLLTILVAVGVYMISAFNITLTEDKMLNTLLLSLIQKGILVLYLAYICIAFKMNIFKFTKKGLIWAIPCFLVAVINFPFSGLISGSAKVTRLDLVPLFILSCLLTGLVEEFIFRVLLYPEFKYGFAKSKYAVLWATLASSAIFGLLHLVNIAAGASVGATLLQVGYSFLIGCMLCVTYEKTKNYWVLVIIHAAFNIGGNLIFYCGEGSFQDTTFWILTITGMVLVAGHIVYTLINLIRKPN